MEKTDFKKEFKHLYKPSTKDFVVVDVPPMQFLMIDGHGDPNTTQEYKGAIEALYPVAYKLKFMSKKELEKDYVVMPLEGLWWVEDMETFTSGEKSAWDWTMMIMVPEWITQEMFEAAVQQVEKKGLPALHKMRLEMYHEGLSVQIMHHGSYDDEAPTLEKMHHEWLPENGYEMAGKHHEVYIYTGDPRRGPVDPAKLRTVLRQPIRKACDMQRYQDCFVPPCGIFCGGCPRYVRDKNPCLGAEVGCRKCKGIYVCCVEKRGHRFCFECSTFPCSRFSKFAERWKKYGQDLVKNQRLLEQLGEDKWREVWNNRVEE